MVTKEQIELAKTTWEWARQSAALAHQAWTLILQSQKALMNNMRQAGPPYTEVSKQFEALLDEHAEKYKMALEQLDNAAKIYSEFLEELKKKSA